MVARRTGIIVAAVVIAVAGSVVGYAVSPYFTESTINESMPVGAIVISSGNVESVDEATSTAIGLPTDTDVMVSYAGTFVGVGDGIHDASGQAYTIPLVDGGSVLRLENFFSTNGPGLRVYLATDKTAADHVSLGDLKANRGNQNYELPPGIDLEKYDNVLIWCEPFSVLFGSATLSVR